MALPKAVYMSSDPIC